MGPGRDRTRDPWIRSQTRICCQTRYRLRYAARLTINVILNGNENWNTEVNVVLFGAVHRYIHTSKRF